MKGIILLAATLCAAAAYSRPLIIEESARVASPDPEIPFFAQALGMEGNDAIILGHAGLPPTDPGDQPDTLTRAFLFRYVDGEWAFVRQLDESRQDNELDAPNQYAVRIENGIAAVAMINLRVFERQGNGDFTRGTVQHAFDAPSQYLDIDGDTIFFGDECWGGSFVRKEADGVWRAQARLRPEWCGEGDGANGGVVAFAGDFAAVPAPFNFDSLPAPALFTFQRSAPGVWNQRQRIVAEQGHFFGHVAMTPDVMYVQDSLRYGTPRYYRSPADNLWRPSGIRLRADSDHRAITAASPGYIPRLAIGENFVLRMTWDPDRQAGVVHVFRYVEPGVIAHAATLVSSIGASLEGHLAVSGRRVMIGGGDEAHFFELPASLATPAPAQDDFEGAGGITWGAMPGEPFTIAGAGGTHVFRQSGTAGEAGAVVENVDWTNQSIQVDVTPRTVNGADRWVGLMTRRTNASNYYYVTLRSIGVVQLKRMIGGTFTTMDAAPVPFTPGRTYRLRLESVGSRHRVYVDGGLVLEAFDEDQTRGRPGLLMYKAAADYDNVVVTPADLATIWHRDGPRVCDFTCPEVEWETADGDWAWRQEGENFVFAQDSLVTAARAPAGAPTRNLDQVVESRARLRAFGTGHDPWFGVMARYRDVNNYVYLSLRRSNTLTLRKLVNGEIVELGSVPVTVAPGAWNRLRLDAVGTRLRAFVNGRQVLEAVDAEPVAGQVGVLTYRTQADFDDFLAVRP